MPVCLDKLSRFSHETINIKKAEVVYGRSQMVVPILPLKTIPVALVSEALKRTSLYQL